MDQNHAVEAFRNMMIQREVVLKDNEITLWSLLISDGAAVEYFFDNYLDVTNKCRLANYRKRTLSHLEFEELFESDLQLLGIYAQYLESMLISNGLEAVMNIIHNLGFRGFACLPMHARRRLVTHARSKATRKFYDLREAYDLSRSKRTKKLGKLLTQ